LDAIPCPASALQQPQKRRHTSVTPTHTHTQQRQEAASGSAAAQELPSAAAQVLLQLYDQQAPPHLQAVVREALQRHTQAGGSSARGAGGSGGR
jgi:gamma-glutamyltranspeptidase